MALKVGELYGVLGLDDSQFQSKMGAARNSLSQLGSAFSQAGRMLTLGVTAPLVGAALAAGKAAADYEQAEIAFTQMLGSGEAATRFLGQLRDFAAKTPFELPGLMDSSRKLLAFGFSADRIVPMLTNIGDAVSALGGGAFEIDRVTRAVGQMQAKGKVSAEEMMQLAELGIPGWQMLANAIGKTTGEVMKMAEQGKITAETGINAILGGMAERFGGGMAKQSKTFLGMLSTLIDDLKAVAIDVGKPIIESLKSLMQSGPVQAFLKFLKGLAEGFKNLPKPVQMIIIALAGLAAAIGPLMMLIGPILSAIPGIAMLAPILGAIAGAAGPVLGVIAAIGAAILLMWKNSAPLRAALVRVWEGVKSVLQSVWSLLKALWAAVSPILGAFLKIAAVPLGAIFSALGFVLKTVAWILGQIAGLIETIVEGLRKIWDWLTGKRAGPTLLNSLIDASMRAIKAQQGMTMAVKEKAKQAILAAEEEAKAVLDVIEKRRQAAEEARKQRMESVGWTGPVELWKGLSEAAARKAAGGNEIKTAVTAQNLPQTVELQKIQAELKEQTRKQDELIKTIRERLAYA